MSKVTRRSVLTMAGAAAVAAAHPMNVLQPPKSKRVLRIAHLTDIHVQPEKKAGEGMAQALKHVHAQKDRPDLILTGGDLIMDAFGADHDRTKIQWDLFAKVLKNENGLPVEHCIGNHDVWGFSKREDKPEYAAKAGKKGPW